MPDHIEILFLYGTQHQASSFKLQLVPVHCRKDNCNISENSLQLILLLPLQHKIIRHEHSCESFPHYQYS